MAIGRKEAIKNHEDSGYLTDESDFYGAEAVKQDLEQQANVFDVLGWWEGRTYSITTLAEGNIKTSTKPKATSLYNPYEGFQFARQLSESVADFSQRLPPQTTPASDLMQWVMIANPFRKVPKPEKSKWEISNEAPHDEESDWAQFVGLGGKLLEELTGLKHEIEKEKAGHSKSSVTKAVNIQKESIVKKILKIATDLHCTSGKWMLFVDSVEINAVWSVVARATANNDLGVAAKVGLDQGDARKPRLICVYTKDFNDMEDVSRVVRKMRELGLVDKKTPIYYKCDAYTYLGLNSNNEYQIKASLYSSTDVLKLKEGKRGQKLESLMYNKKMKDERERCQLE